MKIIIDNSGESSYGPESMANTLCICDCILEGKKDGDTVKATIEGTLVEHEGKRYISVSTVDGEAVEEMDSSDNMNDMEGSADPMETNAYDAVNNFMKMKGK